MYMPAVVCIGLFAVVVPEPRFLPKREDKMQFVFSTQQMHTLIQKFQSVSILSTILQGL